MGEHGPLRAEPDAGRAAWVVDALGAFGTFEGIVPPVFEAAVRVLHPAQDPTGLPLRWREAAGRAGTLLHPLAQWEWLAQPIADEVGPPWTGRIPLDELAEIARVLARHTTTPDDCLAVFWEGSGVLAGGSVVLVSRAGGPDAEPERLSGTRPTGRDHPEIAAAVSVSLPGRDGPLLALDVRALTDPRWARDSGFADASGISGQTPLALWPEDRAWYVATEVDVDSTVIGGSRALVDGILALAAEGAVEALELRGEVDLTSTGDRVNGRG